MHFQVTHTKSEAEGDQREKGNTEEKAAGYQRQGPEKRRLLAEEES